METGISSIAAKIDAVLTKLGAMDSGKAMRRAMMNKKLNSVMADDNGEREREENFLLNLISILKFQFKIN